MNYNWLLSQTNPDLEKEVSLKIKKVQEFEKHIPAVIIIHDLITSYVVYMSERGLNDLGITLEDIRLPMSEYHVKFFNPEDAAYYVPKILDLVQKNDPKQLVSYFQQVRLKYNPGWVWHLSSSKIFHFQNEKPRLIITISQAVDTQHPIATKVDKLLEENTFLRNNHHIFSTLTKREKQILKCMALGHSSMEIAGNLHISETTANTHRRNIRRKINANSIYDITRFAQAFDLI
jgi:DNA-binding CsgD family transcriptional regulator